MTIKDVTGRDPFSAYEKLRSEGRVLWDDGLQGWLLSDYGGCSEAARQEGKAFVPPWGDIQGGREILGRYGLYLLRGDEHREFHLALQQWFSQASADPEMIKGIRQMLDDIVSDLDPPGRVEFWSQVAEVLPGRVMLKMLGLPVEEPLRIRLLELNHYLNAWFVSFGTSEQSRVEAISATAEVFELTEATIRARRDKPAADLISELWRIGREMFSDWNEEDIAKHIFFLMGAGTFNTSSVLSATAYMLVSTPNLSEQIAETPALVPTLVEEVMRLWGPVQLRTRKAIKDIDLAGVHIQKDDIVYPVLGSANRDPGKYSCPNDLDLERSRSRTHLAFYAGSRFCLGAPLARLEATEIVLGILRVFPNARLAPGASAPLFEGLTYRNFKPLELVYGSSK
jgi:hypothetical protein